MTGMGYSQVQRYCDNKVTRIDLSVLERICTVLPNCNLNDLIKLTRQKFLILNQQNDISDLYTVKYNLNGDKQ